ncbi:MAG: hypothetical protein ACYSRZ_06910, partial [Planctomycetota bacterium]
MQELEIKIPSPQAQSYRISIGSGMLNSLWQKLETDFGQAGKFIVTDANLLEAGHLGRLLQKRSVDSYIIDP